MDEREKQIRQRLKDDFEHFASKCLKIRTKTGEIKPFLLNKGQVHLHNVVEKQRKETGKVRVIIVKGRQLGCSTYTGGRFYWRIIHSFGMRAFVLAHEEEATKNLFEMTQRYHEHCPILVKPHTAASNSKELIFDRLDSGYKLGTAGNKATGRSQTIQFLHGSEVAFWPNASEHASGVMQAVPNCENTEIFLESTAKGVGSYFHNQWQLAESGESDFIPIFIPWYWQDEYKRTLPMDFTATDEECELSRLYGLSNEQLLWRRYKIAEFSSTGMDGAKVFAQEYPNNSIEAFQNAESNTFISNDLVMKARKSKALERIGAKVMGVDPARFGDDRTSIIFRQGRVAYGLQSYVKKDTMEVAGIVYQLIMKEKPDRVFVDVGGLGAGVVDRLKELVDDHRLIVAVNAGSKALDEDRYVNKRAEMWGLVKEWLEDFPCSLPDEDSLHGDLCGIMYNYDSKTRLVMESKDHMKRRGLRSPDTADALCLTFALPVQSLNKTKQKDDILAQSMARQSQAYNQYRDIAYGRR